MWGLFLSSMGGVFILSMGGVKAGLRGDVAFQNNADTMRAVNIMPQILNKYMETHCLKASTEKASKTLDK